MRYLSIDSSLFITNRNRLKELLPSNGVVIINSNDIMPTNADGEMPFKQNSNLYYLTGIDQEESIFVMYYSAESNSYKELLFVKETNDLIKVWEGEKLTKSAAQAVSRIEDVFWLSEFEAVFKSILAGNTTFWLNSNEHARATSAVQTRDQRFIQSLRLNYPHFEFKSVAYKITQLRYVKSQLEIDQIKTACDITEKAFRRVLKFIKPNVYEFEVEAEISHEFLMNRSRGHAYQPIIASGVDSCVLHYLKNSKQCLSGDVVLMDFGAEYANYNADLTRTIPVNGKYSERQKAVYNAVLRVMKNAKLMLVPGTTFELYNQEIGKWMESELLGLGLIDKTDIKNQNPKAPAYRRYFMHGTSHSLGLDVHDVDDRSIPFKEGMVFTCEPGIYIPEEKIGVRIENDLVVRSEKPEDLMGSIPIEVDEIEDLMNKV